MEVFKTNKKIFWTNEIKSWFLTLLILTISYFCLQKFFLFKQDRLELFVFVILILKVGDTLTQYHVTEIKIDLQNNQLTFLLRSIMSGKKAKNYELDSSSSVLNIKSGLTKYFISPYKLKILLNHKDTFSLTDRYGFSLQTLIQIDKTIKKHHNYFKNTKRLPTTKGFTSAGLTG